MARTALTVQDVTIAGLVPSFAAANVDGNSLPANGQSWIEVVNASGVSVTVTIPTVATLDGRAVADDTVAVAAGTTRKIGPFVGRLHGQDGGVDDGDAYVNYSAVTSVTVGAFEL